MTLSTFLLIIAGLVLLTVGGELLVRGAVSLAERLGVSRLLIGLTLVGFGTSTPELVTSVQAALAGAPGIAIGNVVGSNIANVLLILGLTALIRPVLAAPAAFARDGAMLAIATLLGLGAILLGEVGRTIGIFFIMVLVSYIVVTYRHERRAAGPSAELHRAEADTAPHLRGSALKLTGVVIAGLLLTMLGASWLVRGAIELARGLDVSETVIGLTIVAVGTSLPELVTSIAAARHKHSDVALGNIIGSNIYNILGILGVTAVIHPITVPNQILVLDIWVMLGAVVALFATVLTGWRIIRAEGAALLSLYVVYTGYLAIAKAVAA
jgi:cation:H+ antiporter